MSGLTRREAWLAGAGLGAALLSGCAAPGGAAEVPGELITEGVGGRRVSRAELLARLRDSDFVLLGEQHDNPLQHQRRGALIVELGSGAVVVAEHLPRGARVEGAATDALLARLQAAGFEPRGWRWPLHEGLFAPPLAAGIPLRGGNAPLDQVRAVARQAEAALPADMAALLATAPLETSAQAALDQALVDGHCGQLPAARVPAMRAAQRLRDASMAAALLAAGGRPAVLVAGNGHVRDDHGVPVLLRAQRPAARIVSVVFVDSAMDSAVNSAVNNAGAAPPATYRWLTAAPPTPRTDPCAGFTLPPPRR